MPDWKTLKSEIVYETAWIKVRRDDVLNHNSKPMIYSVVELQHPSVFIVATNKKGEIMLQFAYKYTIDREVWAMPAGFMEDGENPLVAAKRELLEESGMASDDWTDLGIFYQAIGIGKIPYAVFLARDVYPATSQEDELENIIRHEFKPVTEVEQMIAAGDFPDSPVIAALYAAKIHGI